MREYDVKTCKHIYASNARSNSVVLRHHGQGQSHVLSWHCTWFKPRTCHCEAALKFFICNAMQLRRSALCSFPAKIAIYRRLHSAVACLPGPKKGPPTQNAQERPGACTLISLAVQVHGSPFTMSTQPHVSNSGGHSPCTPLVRLPPPNRLWVPSQGLSATRLGFPPPGVHAAPSRLP
jgi:hypothetical protein